MENTRPVSKINIDSLNDPSANDDVPHIANNIIASVKTKHVLATPTKYYLQQR